MYNGASLLLRGWRRKYSTGFIVQLAMSESSWVDL
jgi:hypothetical protein